MRHNDRRPLNRHDDHQALNQHNNRDQFNSFNLLLPFLSSKNFFLLSFFYLVSLSLSLVFTFIYITFCHQLFSCLLILSRRIFVHLLLSTCCPPLVLHSNRFTVSSLRSKIRTGGLQDSTWQKNPTKRKPHQFQSLTVPTTVNGTSGCVFFSDQKTSWSFEAITTITSRINRRVFLEVINSETSDKANLLWSKINEQYASKRAMNKGRVWMNWQKANYSGNLHQYIEESQKFLLELDSVSVKMPSEILLYIILGKLAGDPKLNQVVELLTLNEEIIEKPDQIFSRLQEYANHCQTKDACSTTPASASALVSSTSNEPYRIVYYCSNGKHNPKCVTHKKEECFAENPHLRPQRQNNKRKNLNSHPEAHISTAQALFTNANQRLPPGNWWWTVGQLTTCSTLNRLSPLCPKTQHSPSPQETRLVISLLKALEPSTFLAIIRY
ncbi:hypothetical protein O181_081567 [Austropuccinia psidii MF-1]|uniref:Uncharacterized protein n=1 Tax=Austropuccinia psidii MF-1 TaxID=1389203 RepID=A0A9Q3FNV0_9BASI|nr:hypothetical protein [Austropuccinia psidii MF-1]